jgi:glutathione reductase (NADPH)
MLKNKRDAYIKRLNGIYERNLNNDKVQYYSGYASFVDKNTVKIQDGDKVSEVQAKKILIAVGEFIEWLGEQKLTKSLF